VSGFLIVMESHSPPPTIFLRPLTSPFALLAVLSVNYLSDLDFDPTVRVLTDEEVEEFTGKTRFPSAWRRRTTGMVYNQFFYLDLSRPTFGLSKSTL
jgi:hypothetical protein